MYSVLYQVIGFMYRTVLMYSVLYQVIGFMYHTVLMYSVLYQVIAFVCRTGTVHCTGVGSISALADRRTASFECTRMGHCMAVQCHKIKNGPVS